MASKNSLENMLKVYSLGGAKNNNRKTISQLFKKLFGYGKLRGRKK